MSIFSWIFGRARAPQSKNGARSVAPPVKRSMEDIMVDRNVKGIALEAAGDWEAVIALYEANINDHFDGSHPYERLMIIYARSGMLDDAKRVARACLAQATAGLSDKVRARCTKVLAKS